MEPINFRSVCAARLIKGKAKVVLGINPCFSHLEARQNYAVLNLNIKKAGRPIGFPALS